MFEKVFLLCFYFWFFFWKNVSGKLFSVENLTTNVANVNLWDLFWFWFFFWPKFLVSIVLQSGFVRFKFWSTRKKEERKVFNLFLWFLSNIIFQFFYKLLISNWIVEYVFQFVHNVLTFQHH